ncbi:MAG TPA: FlgD immunoglobulin-like domain containing protein, partial [Candidatus Udaeobacter sp.]|nr:FlgD immunoglobulin-like domain containing protein [Candidatus Udaeobacter sp.]
GSAAPTLDASDRSAIFDYLAGHGKLLLSGQDVAYDLCDPASPNYSPENLAWYQTRFQTGYVANNSNSTSLTGVAGDPISNGLNLTIQGGSGANNQTDPDVLTPLPGAGTIWTYGAGPQTAATRILGQGYRAVNLGFGFEGVANAADRQTILDRALRWLAGSSVGIEDTGVAHASHAVAIAPPRPNPFNPATILAFDLARAGDVALRILGPDGRVVRTLVAAQLPAGHHEAFWDGRDTQGRDVASGVYLAEVILAGAESARTKLNLVR